MLDVLLVVVIDPSAVTALATVAKFQLVVTLFLRQSILEVPPQLKPVVKSKALGFVKSRLWQFAAAPSLDKS